MIAWRQARQEIDVDDETLFSFEYNLHPKLFDLAVRLNNGSYYSMTKQSHHNGTATRDAQDIDIQKIEDAIVQQAVFNALEPIFMQQFLDCSVFNCEMADGRLRDYRNCGDEYVVEAEIADCIRSLDHDLLMLLIGERIEDERLLPLIWFWLKTDRILANDNPYQVPSGYIEMTRNLLGRNVGLFALASMAIWVISKWMRRPINLKTILLAAAAMFTALNYKKVARLLPRSLIERFNHNNYQPGAVNCYPLPTLLVNIVLHEFDLAMTEAGLHFVRMVDRFAITVRDEESSDEVLGLAERELARLGLRLNLSKTYITRFDG